MNFYFDDFTEGSTYRSAWLQISEEDIVRFASEFDPQPFHLDREMAGRSAFGGLIASGMHSASLCIKLAIETGLFRDCSIAGLGVEGLRWLRPLRPDDRVQLEFSVSSTRRSASNPARGIVTFLYRLFNQRGEVVTTMSIAKVLKARPQAEIEGRPES
ncbi:MAG: MaoC family dehydratase [Burkholderiales bacterium]|nr:MaoC family dehydratase [Burkholderiales bacterium]